MTKKDLLIIIGGIAILVFAFGMNVSWAQGKLTPQSYQCATCENAAKTENSISPTHDELYLPEVQIITELYIKAGQGCYVPDGVCYNVISGGIGYNYVVVEKIGDGPGCQDISHLEVCYVEDPTATNTATSTADEPTDTPENPTPTIEFTGTPIPEPSETIEPTLWPTLPPPPRGKG